MCSHFSYYCIGTYICVLILYYIGTTQPSRQAGGAEVEAEDSLCGVENVGDARGRAAVLFLTQFTCFTAVLSLLSFLAFTWRRGWTSCGTAVSTQFSCFTAALSYYSVLLLYCGAQFTQFTQCTCFTAVLSLLSLLAFANAGTGRGKCGRHGWKS
jgi:hypothetical protein